MKKIITTILAIAFGFALFAVPAFAGGFNDGPQDLPTVMVSNYTQNPCAGGPGVGCWTSSVSANPGDVVSVRVYYHNTTNQTAYNTSIGLGPKDSSSNSYHTFTGGVAVGGMVVAEGSAYVQLSSSQTLNFIPGTVRWYPNQTTSNGQSVSNEASLFANGNGMSIGNIGPGWGTQGSVVANFKVGSYTQPTPSCTLNLSADRTSITAGEGVNLSWTSSNCSNLQLTNVGSVSTSGSKTVYPTINTTYTLSGTGSNGTVTDSVTISVRVPDQYCSVNLTANPTTINQGQGSTLSWTSSNCTNLQLTEVGSVSTSGSRVVYPSQTTTYTLTGYGSNGQTVKSSVTVVVNQVIQPVACSIYSFTADRSNIDRGGSTFLRWSTSNADYVSITSFGTQNGNSGSLSVSPFDTTTYTLTAYCNGTSATRSLTITVNAPQVGVQPEAITTVATVLSSTTARLNGIAVPNTAYGTTYAWFEWGPTQSLGYITNKQIISTNTSTYYNFVVTGLTPGTTYYYKAVVQNQYGTANGSIVPFQTSGAIKSNTTTTTIIKYVPQPASSIIVSKSAPSLLELKVESIYDHMCVGGTIDYTITYRNISTTQTLENAVLRVTIPKEMDYVSGNSGNYNSLDRTLSVPLANIPPAGMGTVQMRVRVNNTAVTGNLAVTTATVVYTNTKTHAQEDAIAYSLVTISNECPNFLGASVFGLSFLPHTLVGWLLLIVVILALIVLARQLYKKQPTA